jgi:hypothetical protein
MLRYGFPVGVLLGALWAQGAGAGVASDNAGATAVQPSAQTTSGAPAATAPALAKPSSKAGPASAGGPSAKKAGAAARAKPAGAPTRYRPDRFAGRAGSYYRLIWGVDSIAVKWAESGEVLRFTYRVLDPVKAQALNDKKNEPSLIDPERGVSLVVPSMENVGQLRQSAPPEGGKAYWMVFSNKGRPVKRGDHVNVVIGAFHANGLVVD